MEQWKVVKGTEGKIFVSDLGRVKSFLRNPEGNILRQQVDAKGYMRIAITINGTKLRYKTHRLVAEAFVDNTANKPQVNHINGNKKDNRACNLEWVTNKENAHHAIKNGLFDNLFAEAKAENRKRQRAVIAIDTKTYQRICFESISAAERYFNSRHITAVLKGNRQKVKGYTFEYADKGGDVNVS